MVDEIRAGWKFGTRVLDVCAERFSGDFVRKICPQRESLAGRQDISLSKIVADINCYSARKGDSGSSVRQLVTF
jgi:hypothetical protein